MTVLPVAAPRRRRPGPAAVAALLAATAAAVFGLGLLVTQIAASRTGPALWWPGAAPATVGVALAAAGCGRWSPPTGSRRVVLVVAVLVLVGLAGAAVRLLAGRSPELALGWALGDVVAATAAGLLLAGRLRLRSLPDLGRLVLAALAGAFGAGVVVTLTTVPPLSGAPVALFWSVTASWATAVLLLVPLVMQLPRRRTRRHPAETAGLWVLAVGTTVATFAPGQAWPLAFVPPAVLIGSGLRLGPRAVVWQILVVAVLVGVLSLHGAGPFAAVASVYAPVALVQTFVVVVACAVLAVATTVARRDAVQDGLQAAVRFHDAVLAASPEIIFLADAGTNAVLWASRSVETMLGFVPQQVLDIDRGAGPGLGHPDDRAGLHAANDAATLLLDGEVQPLRVRVGDGAGRYRWLSRQVTPFTRDPGGRVTELLGFSRDITDIVESEQRMEHAATHDPLTGLLNRRGLGDRLTAVIARAEAGTQTPVLFCDLDGFKAVNDAHGHAVGDALLAVTGQRIAGALRAGDTLARTGGDEFVVVLEAPSREHDSEHDSGRDPADPAAEALHRARGVARRIAESLARPMDVQGTVHVIAVSIGIALARRGLDAADVLRDADTAMYRAKAAGRNRHHVYEVAPPGRSDPPGPS